MPEAALSTAAVTPSAPPVRLHIVRADAAAAERAAAPRLSLAPYDLGAALGLERELGIGHVLSQVLIRRGIADPAQARAFLYPAEEHPPGAFAGIDAAVGLIQRHIAARHPIVVHGDYDVDGVCATAIMMRALRTLGAEVRWFLPSRLEDGYGVSAQTISRLAAAGTRLLITVDCGITAVEEVAAARAAGLDVVLTDHHAPRANGELPQDCAIVHPVVCGYPCAELCGTAVAFKLTQALGAPGTEDDLELVALATVADLMPLHGENRRLVRDGLRAMSNTTRPGLRALMTVSRTDPSALDAQALGFRLAPRINAAGRLARADAGLELLLTDDEQRAAEIAQELDRVNAERRALEQRITWEAEAQISALGDRPAYVLAGEGWHPGVVGIVASRVVEAHHRPALLIALGEDGIGHGSGRSIPGFDLLAALHATSGHMLRYGGHRAAAGLTIASSEIDDLRAGFERFAGHRLTPELLTPLERIDAIISGADVGLRVAEELAQLEPCGMGNPQPRLLIPGARFDHVQPMGDGRHARFSVTSAGARASAVAFGCGGKLATEPGRPLQAAFKLERDVWKGVVQPRLILRHAWPCEEGDIQVLGERQPYLEAVLEELDAASGETPQATGTRTLLDRRGESPLAVLADARAAGDAVLALCADVPRRLGGLQGRAGGFALSCYHAVERGSVVPEDFEHLILLDPPADGGLDQRLSRGNGFTHRAWSIAELRFAQQMHELEYGLRASLVTLYRSLRARSRVAGEELERLLRGDGSHPRPARLAGRLIKVLAELELVSLDRDLPALEVAARAPTVLERSPTYRVCVQRYEDGLRFLNRENHRLSA